VLAAGMSLVTGKTGNAGFSNMQIVKIAVAIAETGRLSGVLFVHQSSLMALEAKPGQREFQEIAMRRSMRGMAAETVMFDDRRMDALLA